MKNTIASTIKLYLFLASFSFLWILTSCSEDEDDQTNTGVLSADFTASSQSIQAGGTINFTSTSTGALLQNWTFEGGTPTFTDQLNPQISYATPGSYSVTLIVFGEEGTDTETKENFITVTEGDSGGGTGGGTGSDSTPPTVTSVSPTNGATDVPLGSDITIVFSEDLAPESVSSSSIFLSNGSSVSASVTLNGNSVTVNPSQNLKGGNTTYTINITGSVTDLAGNAISPADYTFTTLNDQPTVVSSVPSADAENVSVDQTIEVTFSSNLDPSTVSSSTVKLFYDNTLEQAGQVSVSGNKLIFNPTATMREYTTFYYLRLSSGIKDVNGNVLESELRINFKTDALVPGVLYMIRNPSSNEVLRLEGANYQVVTSSVGTTSLDFWKVKKTGSSIYVLINNQAEQNLSEPYALEGATPNDGQPVLYTGMVDVNTPFRGQRWQILYANKVETSTNRRVHNLRHISTGTRLNFFNRDITSNDQTSAYECVFERVN